MRNGNLSVERGAEALDRVIASAAASDRVKYQTGTQSASAGDSAGASLVLLAGESIRPAPVRWLWEGWLARGKLHILAGAPGTGKTTIALALAATVSRGGRWPDGSQAQQGSVLIASFEDNPKDTLAPRLLAMDADMTRIKFLLAVREGNRLRSLHAGDHASVLAEAIRKHDVRLVIVDPVISALGSFDSHRNAETRMALQPFADVAAEAGVAVFGIAHFSKGTAGREPLERVSGSLAFGALARVVLGTARVKTEDGAERRMLLRLKSNIGPDDGGFEYSLKQFELEAHPGVSGSLVQWGEGVEGSARELLAEADTVDDGEGGAITEATCWLRSVLADSKDSALDKKTIIAMGRGAGFAERTLQRARRSLGIEPQIRGFGGDKKSVWALPKRANDANCANVCQPQELGTNGTDDGASLRDPDIVEVEI